MWRLVDGDLYPGLVRLCGLERIGVVGQVADSMLDKVIERQFHTSQGKLGWLGWGHSYLTDLLLAWLRGY